MKLLKLTIFLLALPAVSFGFGDPCKPTAAKSIPDKTTVFFYKYTKSGKSVYVPFAQLFEGKISTTEKVLIPTQTTLFDLRNNKPIKLKFKNEWDNQTECVSTAKANDKSGATLLASKPMAESFDFTPAQTDSAVFKASVESPCASGSKYDANGVASCNADALIATSNLSGQKQFWNTKQYRYDVGFAVNTLDAKTNRFNMIIENCSLCKD